MLFKQGNNSNNSLTTNIINKKYMTTNKSGKNHSRAGYVPGAAGCRPLLYIVHLPYCSVFELKNKHKLRLPRQTDSWMSSTAQISNQ